MTDTTETLSPKRYLFVITENCDILTLLSTEVAKILETQVDPDYTQWTAKAQYLAIQTYNIPGIGVGARALGDYFEMLEIPLQWLAMDQGLLYLAKNPELETIVIWDSINPSVKDLVAILRNENRVIHESVLGLEHLLY